MNRILLVDDMSIYCEPISIALQQRGYEVETAIDGIDALNQLDKFFPDIVLLDIVLPYMDGLTCLKVLRKRPSSKSLPVILLTAVAERDYVLKAKELGVNGYLLKSYFSLDDLCHRIDDALSNPVTGESTASADHDSAWDANEQQSKRATHLNNQPASASPREQSPTSPKEHSAQAPSPKPDLKRIDKSEITQRLRQHSDLRPFSGVVADVIAMASSGRSDAAELATVLKKDPVLSTRVLHVANSANSQTVRTKNFELLDAVKRIGFSKVSKLAASVGVFESVPLDASTLLGAVRHWQHSFAVASLMEQLITDTAYAYLVGLCHDLDSIIMRIVFAEEYAYVDQAAVEPGGDFREIERRVFGMPHHELIDVVLKRLCVPEDIAEPILQFHRHAVEPKSKRGRLDRALRVANSYAHGLLLAPHASANIEPIHQSEFNKAAGRDRSITTNDEELRADVLLTTGLLARLSSKDRAASHELLLPQLDIEALHVRDQAFADFDPIEATLRSMTKVATSPHLPRNENELEGCTALIVTVASKSASGWSLPRLEQTFEQCCGSGAARGILLGPADSEFSEIRNAEYLTWPVTIGHLHSRIAGAVNLPG
ncbi:MAG: HDOD domain-containing protein [Phycisphaerales bacterium]|nr:HDOD domain-containing protein [Phycisphaerales bacterium]